MTAPAATAPTLHAIGGAETRAAPVPARHSPRAEARTDLLRLFARIRGVEAPRADLLEALTRAAGADDSYDGPVLADSNAICEFLDETYPDPALFPGDAASRAEVRRP